MPEPLKNRYTPEFIQVFCSKITTVYPKFNAQGFSQFVFDEHWQNKQLKARMRHITLGLGQFLPKDYQQSIAILTKVCAQLESSIDGLLWMSLPDFVEVFGLDDYQTSIKALAIFTPIASAEFAIRVFIELYPEQTMQQMQQWANSDNEHCRRLASEGARPMLPWASALPDFKKNPDAILPILTTLRDDKSAYVRRSVANNLNDISKHNPQIVIKLTKQWLGYSHNRDKLLKHACRTLLKQARPEIMQLFNFHPPQHIKIKKFSSDLSVKIGQSLNFSFMISSQKTLGLLRIEYGIYFMRSNKNQHKKIFKISEANYQNKQKNICKTHSFKPISSRKYYIGKHKLCVIINGVEQISQEFLLTI